MSRYKTPEHVKQYYETLEKGPPKCCHTCDWYKDDGECYKFKMVPPEDFASSIGQCPEWFEVIPF